MYGSSVHTPIQASSFPSFGAWSNSMPVMRGREILSFNTNFCFQQPVPSAPLPSRRLEKLIYPKQTASKLCTWLRWPDVFLPKSRMERKIPLAPASAESGPCRFPRIPVSSPSPFCRRTCTCSLWIQLIAGSPQESHVESSVLVEKSSQIGQLLRSTSVNCPPKRRIIFLHRPSVLASF